MNLWCPACEQVAVKRGRAKYLTCPECHGVIEEPTEETCLAVLTGEIEAERFQLGYICADCRHYGCPVKAPDAEEQDRKAEMSSMFGGDEEAEEAFWEGYDPDKD